VHPNRASLLSGTNPSARSLCRHDKGRRGTGREHLPPSGWRRVSHRKEASSALECSGWCERAVDGISCHVGRVEEEHNSLKHEWMPPVIAPAPVTNTPLSPPRAAHWKPLADKQDSPAALPQPDGPGTQGQSGDCPPSGNIDIAGRRHQRPTPARPTTAAQEGDDPFEICRGPRK